VGQVIAADAAEAIEAAAVEFKTDVKAGRKPVLRRAHSRVRRRIACPARKISLWNATNSLPPVHREFAETA
jgi:hypothetical protein